MVSLAKCRYSFFGALDVYVLASCLFLAYHFDCENRDVHYRFHDNIARRLYICKRQKLSDSRCLSSDISSFRSLPPSIQHIQPIDQLQSPFSNSSKAYYIREHIHIRLNLPRCESISWRKWVPLVRRRSTLSK